MSFLLDWNFEYTAISFYETIKHDEEKLFTIPACDVYDTINNYCSDIHVINENAVMNVEEDD